MLYRIYHIVLYSIVSFPHQLSIYLHLVCQACQLGVEYMLFEEVILLLLKSFSSSLFSLFSHFTVKLYFLKFYVEHTMSLTRQDGFENQITC